MKYLSPGMGYHYLSKDEYQLVYSKRLANFMIISQFSAYILKQTFYK